MNKDSLKKYDPNTDRNMDLEPISIILVWFRLFNFSVPFTKTPTGLTLLPSLLLFSFSTKLFPLFSDPKPCTFLPKLKVKRTKTRTYLNRCLPLDSHGTKE